LRERKRERETLREKENMEFSILYFDMHIKEHYIIQREFSIVSYLKFSQKCLITEIKWVAVLNYFLGKHLRSHL